MKNNIFRLGLRLSLLASFVLPLSVVFSASADSGAARGSTEKIRILYEDGVDAIGTYCMGMVELALESIDHNYEIEVVTGDYSPARVIESVRTGELTLMWGSGDKDMEQQLLPVHIPLYKGLLGHRIMIIHPDNQYKFDQVNTLEDLQRLTFGQGTTWADTRILEHNGLHVHRVNKYPSLFYMIDGGRFDALPRGVQEPWSEIASRPELDLTVEQRLMLVYRMPFYLYVSHDNPQLAADLERGLRIAIADGRFDEFFFNDPTVQDVLSKAQLQNRVIIPLDNPTMSAGTPVDEPELWLDINAL